MTLVEDLVRLHLAFCQSYEAEGPSQATQDLADRLAATAEALGMDSTAAAWRSPLVPIRHLKL